MATCEVCGNDYDGAFTVTFDGQDFVFDCFECAIHRLAPVCARCGVKTIGHGIQAEDQIYCCAHCATRAGGPQRVGRTRCEPRQSTSEPPEDPARFRSAQPGA